jgi:hypothetical protein
MLLFSERHVQRRGQRSLVEAATPFICSGGIMPDTGHVHDASNRTSRLRGGFSRIDLGQGDTLPNICAGQDAQGVQLVDQAVKIDHW